MILLEDGVLDDRVLGDEDVLNDDAVLDDDRVLEEDGVLEDSPLLLDDALLDRVLLDDGVLLLRVVLDDVLELVAEDWLLALISPLLYPPHPRGVMVHVAADMSQQPLSDVSSPPMTRWAQQSNAGPCTSYHRPRPQPPMLDPRYGWTRT